MKRTLAIACLTCLASAGPMHAARQASGPIAVPGQSVQPGAPDKLSAADLEELLAPIALYPDPLLANILAASVYPDEVAEAAKLAAGGANAAKIDAADWEPPVKAVAKVPDAIKMMGDYIDWTRALGQAYILQSTDVMKAVQSLRSRANANGSLQTTPQQTVATQGDTIVIQPAQPDVIYVPTYNPSVVYVDSGPTSDDVAAAGIIGFGVGIAVGALIADMDCDWHGGCVCWGHGDVDIDINRGDINIDNTNINNIRNNPGREGGRWQPNTTKTGAAPRTDALKSYKGVGSGSGANARVPGRAANAAPIASRPAPRPSASPARAGSPAPRHTANAPARPAAQSVQRPASMPSKIPAARPAPSHSARPATPPPAARSHPSSRSSVYGGGGGGGRAASRGAASRGGGGGGRRR